MGSDKKSLFVCLLGLVIAGCKHKAPPMEVASTGNFPKEIGAIFETRCATAGCHNAKSYENAGGLLLDSWEHLFDGGNSGAVVVPYSVDYSSLLYFINTDSTMGPVAEPRMPYNQASLTKEEYLRIRDWIAQGAPDRNGNIPFASDPGNRQKAYMIHQGCDVVAVIDAATHLVMRYVPLGTKPYPESATYVKSSPDGRYVYVCFWYSSDVYKIDTQTDQVVGTFNTGNSFWNSIAISKDGERLALTNGDSYELAVLDTRSGQIDLHSNTGFVNPLGLAASPTFDTFYVTSQYGNTIYKYSNSYTRKISVDGKPLTTATGNTPDPYEIIMSPDDSKYFVSCEKSAEVRIFNRADDGLVKTIPVGLQPRTMTLAKSMPYLFVACMEDESTTGFKGSVYVINYETLEIVKIIRGRLYQPHAITVDELKGSVYLFSRNQNYDGPAPHHQGPCSGRNGYYEIYDLTTLEQKKDRRYEVLVDPYISDTRFKK